jgi:hypothetical protein
MANATLGSVAAASPPQSPVRTHARTHARKHALTSTKSRVRCRRVPKTTAGFWS